MLPGAGANHDNVAPAWRLLWVAKNRRSFCSMLFFKAKGLSWACWVFRRALTLGLTCGLLSSLA